MCDVSSFAHSLHICMHDRSNEQHTGRKRPNECVCGVSERVYPCIEYSLVVPLPLLLLRSCYYYYCRCRRCRSPCRCHPVLCIASSYVHICVPHTSLTAASAFMSHSLTDVSVLAIAATAFQTTACNMTYVHALSTYRLEISSQFRLSEHQPNFSNRKICAKNSFTTTQNYSIDFRTMTIFRRFNWWTQEHTFRTCNMCKKCERHGDGLRDLVPKRNSIHLGRCFSSPMTSLAVHHSSNQMSRYEYARSLARMFVHSVRSLATIYYKWNTKHTRKIFVCFTLSAILILMRNVTHTRARALFLSLSIARSLSPGYSESHSAKQNVYYWMLVMLMMLLLLLLLLSRFHTHCTCRATHISSYYPQMEKHTHKSVQKEEK